MELTKDDDKVICTLYKVALERHKQGFPKKIAYQFSDDDKYKHITFLSSPDIDFTIKELVKLKLLSEDICGNIQLTNSAISYMENRFKNGLSEVVDFISKFI